MKIEGFVIFKSGVGYMTDSSPSGPSQRLFTTDFWDEKVPIFESELLAEAFLIADGKKPAPGIEIHEVRLVCVRKFK